LTSDIKNSKNRVKSLIYDSLVPTVSVNAINLSVSRRTKKNGVRSLIYDSLVPTVSVAFGTIISL